MSIVNLPRSASISILLRDFFRDNSALGLWKRIIVAGYEDGGGRSVYSLSFLLEERRAGVVAPTFSLGLLVRSGYSDGLEAAEKQRPRRGKEEPALNDFIRESFWPAIGFRSERPAREPREKPLAYAEKYISPECHPTYLRGNKQSRRHSYWGILPGDYTPPGIDGLAG